MKLEQNFPNPFNPVTKINYSIHQPGLVKILVYDMSGRLIQQLVNEVKTIGSHSVEFNGNAFSSGTYFYSITAGEFRETRQMILIK
ncbi:T9SS type A sorting domain-containing protein [Candidatus Falkowbacteria bacterium]|nr:MAG: T9SS type A sorting domain-containing protein [Candidatus Falkowbacteria bacterium]